MTRDFEVGLRKLHRAGQKRFGEDWIARLKERRAKLESAYATLYVQDRDPIAYSSLSAQAAYVFGYAPARAEYTRQYLHRHREALGRPLFSTPNPSVVSFGGGPASELIGLVRYLEAPSAGEQVTNLHYTVYDKDGNWNDVASGIVDALETDISIEIRYEETDAASRTRMGSVDLSDTDLVMFSYVMSELAKLGRKDEIADNFRTALGRLKSGSKVLFIDSRHPIFIQYFQQCKAVSGLIQRNDDDAPVLCNF